MASTAPVTRFELRMSLPEYCGTDHGAREIQRKFKDLPQEQIAQVQAEVEFIKTSGLAVRMVFVEVAINEQPPNRMIRMDREY